MESNAEKNKTPTNEVGATDEKANSTKTKILRGKPRNSGTLTRDDFDGGPVSLDEIVTGLYLGNLTAATSMETLKSFRIKHILTLDSVPLPQHIIESTFLTTKFVKISDMPKADILHHLDDCVDFISEALEKSENVLVHCYFGVSRSSTAVIAYVMKKHKLDFIQAFQLVKSKRRFVHPNVGFITQLKLYGRMGCKIDPGDKKYKIFRLRLAGEQIRKAKILPQSFNNLIKPDPAITQENPEPIVYRCRKCRRVLASKSHLLQHKNNALGDLTAKICEEAITGATATTTTIDESTTKTIIQQQQPPRLLERIGSQIRKVSLESPIAEDSEIICESLIFVEPIAWMKQILNNTQGRLNCPKCDQKLGNFSWINSCPCPCGEEVFPAFYLTPSRVELSRTVQNVQTTI